MVRTFGLHPKEKGSIPLRATKSAAVAQSVERETENLSVGGSIPPCCTNFKEI